VGCVDEGDQVADLALGEGCDGRAGVVGEDVDLEDDGIEPGVVERDAQAGEGGERVIGAAGVGACGIGHVGELRGVGEDVGAGDSGDPEELGSEGVEGLGVGERGRERGRQRERGDGCGVGAGVAMDAGVVGAGADAGELDGTVVGAMGRVVLEDVFNGLEEGSVAGVERFVDVRGDGAVEGH